MPAKRPPPPPLSYVLRTATTRTEYKGGHAGGLELLFVALPDALARRKAIDALEKAHAKLLARENPPERCRECAGQGVDTDPPAPGENDACCVCGGTGVQP